MSKTILITGGAGFIGANFVHHLYKQYPHYKLIVVDLLTYAGAVDNLPESPCEQTGRLEFWYGNVCNSELMDSLIARSDAVIHFAAESHVTRSIFDNLIFFQTDVLGTHAVANAVLKHRDRVKRFIHISTSEVYGTAENGHPMCEEHPLNPCSPYASAKCGADRLVYSYWATYHLPVVIVRPFNNFGPRQHLEKVVPRFISQCLMDKPLTVHGNGESERDFIYVEDHCRALDLILHSPLDDVIGEVFNVGTGRAISVLEIAQAVVKGFGLGHDQIQFIPDRPGQVCRHEADVAKIGRVLGWTPRTSVEDGLERTIAWYVDNRVWWEKQLWLQQIPIHLPDGRLVYH